MPTGIRPKRHCWCCDRELDITAFRRLNSRKLPKAEHADVCLGCEGTSVTKVVLAERHEAQAHQMRVTACYLERAALELRLSAAKSAPIPQSIVEVVERRIRQLPPT